jgi:hypothetical protein
MAKLGKIDLNAQDADVVDVEQPFTADSSALTVAPQNEVSLAGGAGAIEPMNPMESLMEVFYEMRDSLATLVDIATDSFSQGKDEQRDAELGESETGDGDLMPEEGGGDGGGGGGGFSIPKPGPKMGLVLLMGGLAAIMAFGDKLVPIIAPVLKFIKEKALPFAIDAAKKAFEGIKTVFMYLYDNVWPFIKDNIIMNAVDFVKDSFQGIVDLFGDLKDRFSVLFSDDATWWEKITAFLGIFGDIGKFFVEQFDRLTEFVANIFGISFEPYDGLISYVVGKITETFNKVKEFFMETGTFVVEGVTGAYDFVKQKVMGAFTAVGEWFSDTGTFVVEGVTGAYDFVSSKVMSAFTGISEWFSETGEFLLEGASSIVDWLKEKLKVPFEFLTDLFSFPKSPKEFAVKLFDLILLPYNIAINFLRGIFGFGADEEGNVEPFSLGTFIVDKVTMVIDFIKDLFSFDLPSVGDILKGAGDIIQTLLRAVLPSPDFLTFDTPSVTLFGKKFGGGTISLNPIPDMLYKAAGIDPDTGEDLIVKADEGTTLVTGKSVQTESTQAQHKEIADTLESGGDMGGGTVVTNINNSNTKQGDNVTQDTHNYQDLATQHSDPTANMLAEAY